MVSTAVLSSVNVGQVRSVAAGKRRVETAIWKVPAAGRVVVRGVNLEGDDQADRRVHGGPDKAVYAYGLDDYAWWEAELGRHLDPGTFGENLTVASMAVSAAMVGERWAVGSAVLEVCQPRTPCGKLGIRMGDPRFPRRFARAGRPGAYLRIVTEGNIGAGDEISVLSRPDHGLTVAAVARAGEGDSTLVADLLLAPELAEGWVSWAIEEAVSALRSDPSEAVLGHALRCRLVWVGVDSASVDSLVDELIGAA